MSANFIIGLGMFFLRAGLLLACFWVVYGFTRSNPRVRVMLCRIVSVVVVLLPLVNFLPLPAIFSLPSFLRPRVEQAAATSESALPEPYLSGPSMKNEVPLPAVDNDNPPRIDRPLHISAPPPPPPVPAPAREWKFPHPPVPGTLAAAWFAVVCLLLCRWVFSLFMARRLASAAQPPSDWVLVEGRNLCARLGIRNRVTFAVADKVCSPLLLGPAPVILLPRRLVSDDSTADTCAALAHELVHVKQKDWHWSQWMHCIAILAWPLPFAWFLRRAHDASGELVCDHVAAASVGGAESYAGSLARQSLHAIGHPLPATMPMLRKSGIRRRIDLLLSGVRLPSLSWRAFLCALMLTLLAGLLLGGLQLSRAAGEPAKSENPATQHVDVKKKFETLAGESSYFEISNVLYEDSKRLDFKDGLFSAHDANYPAFILKLLAIPAGRDELIALLKHKDPKVRTLAIAALAARNDPTALPFIADLLSDDAHTFSRELPGQDATPPPLRTDVTVAENARQVLFLYLYKAGYNSSNPADISRKDFDDYWNKRKGRAWCASWFSVRLERVLYSDPGAFARERELVRADIEKIPQPERTWTALWVNAGVYGGYNLYSREELLEMCRKLGPEALMNAVKQRRFPGDDPDLSYGNGGPGIYSFVSRANFILENAAALLRPQDSGVLVTLSTGGNSSPWWFIAAAQLQPAKAAEILHAAYGQFAGDIQDHESERMTLDLALWRLGGESQIPFLVDRFYTDALDPASHYKWGGRFLMEIAAIEKPSGRKLIAAILRDKRLDDLDVGKMHFYYLLMARAINGWAKKTVISEDDPGIARVSSELQIGNPADDPLKKDLLHRMRDSVPQWSN